MIPHYALARDGMFSKTTKRLCYIPRYIIILIHYGKKSTFHCGKQKIQRVMVSHALVPQNRI